MSSSPLACSMLAHTHEANEIHVNVPNVYELTWPASRPVQSNIRIDVRTSACIFCTQNGAADVHACMDHVSSRVYGQIGHSQHCTQLNHMAEAPRSSQKIHQKEIQVRPYIWKVYPKTALWASAVACHTLVCLWYQNCGMASVLKSQNCLVGFSSWEVVGVRFDFDGTNVVS